MVPFFYPRKAQKARKIVRGFRVFREKKSFKILHWIDINKISCGPARALFVGIAAMVPCMIGAALNPVPFFRAYLAAYLFFVGLPLGSMVILMIYQLTGGAWGYLLRRILEAQMKTLPLMALLFVPIAGGLRFLYPWAQVNAVAASANLQAKQFYLNPTFFLVRSGLYFLLAIAGAWLLCAWSQKQDQTGLPKYQQRSIRLSKLGLVLYGIAMHFLAIDWLMSLQPGFHSSIFGPIVAMGQLLPAYALSLIVWACVANRPPMVQLVSRPVLLDLGNLLLVLLVLWAYMEWFQFMLIWIANLPGDISWYLPRIHGGWRWVTRAIVVFQFAVPFVLLLFRAVKQRPKVLASIAGWIFFMQLVHRYYQVMPAFSAVSISEHWLDFLTPLSVGGMWLSVFLWSLGRLSLLPPHDHNAAYAAHLCHRDQEKINSKELVTETQELPNSFEEKTKSLAARYEPRDASFRGVMSLLLAIFCLLILNYFAMWMFFGWQKNTLELLGRSHYPLARHSLPELPPSPRLEQLERHESANFSQEKILHSYGTTSEKEFVRIPIEEAILLIAPRLPVMKDVGSARYKERGLLDSGESNSGRRLKE